MWRVLGAAAALGALAAVPMHAAGFGIFEQGSKATGMGGAFTAQADDPSALFYNAGGLAFVTKIDGSIGVTYIHDTKAHFTGANPFPGDGPHFLSQFKGLPLPCQAISAARPPASPE